ncbi:unnamed protein product [Pleuronectes platessa]|uniref:Uncharacterized protein n=1 Tax=Pleuronectes platessa TaxID=8262 RepID=A0A9N7UQF3_PLEPL|nr:unnamed protein product [Pleuronectes platessa]
MGGKTFTTSDWCTRAKPMSTAVGEHWFPLVLLLSHGPFCCSHDNLGGLAYLIRRGGGVAEQWGPIVERTDLEMKDEFKNAADSDSCQMNRGDTSPEPPGATCFASERCEASFLLHPPDDS